VLLAALRRPYVREKADRFALRVPLFGPMLLKLEVSRISRTLGSLLASGVRILDALKITGETVRNLALKSTFPPIVRNVSNGESIAVATEKTGLYPPLMVNLIRTGEDTGELPEMLAQLASIYEDEAERAVAGVVKLLEPGLIILMGAVIGAIVAAVMLPIFAANTMVR
jgi:type IV pilus assembly protein PilC